MHIEQLVRIFLQTQLWLSRTESPNLQLALILHRLDRIPLEAEVLALAPPGVEGDQVPAARAVVEALAGRYAGDVGDREHRGAVGVVAVAGLGRRRVGFNVLRRCDRRCGRGWLTLMVMRSYSPLILESMSAVARSFMPGRISFEGNKVRKPSAAWPQRARAWERS